MSRFLLKSTWSIFNGIIYCAFENPFYLFLRRVSISRDWKDWKEYDEKTIKLIVKGDKWIKIVGNWHKFITLKPKRNYYQCEDQLREATVINNGLILMINVHYPINQTSDQNFGFVKFKFRDNRRIHKPRINASKANVINVK